jgi:NADH dehydrogenase
VTGVDVEDLDIETSDGTRGRIEAFAKVWAAGVQASPLGVILGGQADVTVGHAGRVLVLPNCTLPEHPEVFVVGDLMSPDHLSGMAEAAMQSRRYAAKTIIRQLGGHEETGRSRYRDMGTMATIARFQAVVFTGRIRIAGFLGRMLWLMVHLTFLTGFKNCISVVASRFIAFLGRGGRQPTITDRQIFARARDLEQPGVVPPTRRCKPWRRQAHSAEVASSPGEPAM